MATFISEERKDMEIWYYVDDYWISERNTCQRCVAECERLDKPARWADEQYSFGIYAGKYCEACWKKSGYRDANDAEASFDPADAGEVLEPEDY